MIPGIFAILHTESAPSALSGCASTAVEEGNIEDVIRVAIEACLSKGNGKDVVQPTDRVAFAASVGAAECSLASRDQIAALAYCSASLQTTELPAGHLADVPAWLLDFCEALDTVRDDALVQEAAQALSKLQGGFAFVVYDGRRRRVLAARDAQGTVPLYWGVNQQGLLMLGTERADLKDCYPSATSFPAGSMFLGDDQMECHCPGARGWTFGRGSPVPGRLQAFVPSLAHSHPWRAVQAIPRINSQGALCGAVFRVESERTLAAYAACHQGS